MDYSIKTMHGRRDKLEVIIYSQTHKIMGTVHTMPAGRLVDFLNSKTADLFIVVTDANVYTLPEEELLQTADFFAINKKAIMMVFPKPPGAPAKPGEQSEDKKP
jgi:hypothetical protein